MGYADTALGISSTHNLGVAGRGRQGTQAGQVAIPDDRIACDECYADPTSYLCDHEMTCPLCGGAGHVIDPDWIDEDDCFDPVREYGTLRVISGRVA